MSTDTEIYTACMEDLNRRFRLVRDVVDGKITTADEFYDAEIIFLHFRAMLEQIAFASLAANKDVYATARANFAADWRAVKMLGYLEKVNPDFYPTPLKLESLRGEVGQRNVHFAPLTDGYLTKQDFVRLYDHCSEVLHCWNPYRPSQFRVGRSPLEWLIRIENLVKWHRVQLVSGKLWVGAVPDSDGRVHTYVAEPTPLAGADRR
jgi:hypothetical protein